jgi:hypothetical protein
VALYSESMYCGWFCKNRFLSAVIEHHDPEQNMKNMFGNSCTTQKCKYLSMLFKKILAVLGPWLWLLIYFIQVSFSTECVF